MVQVKGHGFSEQRLDAIDTLLRRNYIDAGRLAGAQWLAARWGEIARVSSLGLRDRAQNLAIEDDTIFRIYSMTKPMTSIAFLMLVEEGLVALDDPVERYIPEWRGLSTEGRVRGRSPHPLMRIVDLLRHTSGLTYGLQRRTAIDAEYRRLGIADFDGPSLADMITALADLPLEFAPGTAWNYSVSTDVLGFLIERISGRPFQDFMQDRLLTPLGMADTGFFVPPDKQHRFATCYTRRAGEKLAVEEGAIATSFTAPPKFVSGGGGLLSTTRDYYRFCKMLIDRGKIGGERLISAKMLALAGANHLPGGVDLPALSVSLFSEASYAGVGFGLGFATTTDPVRSLTMGSKGDLFWGGLASTFFWVDPAEDLVCIFMTQLIPSDAYPIRRQLRSMVYAAIDD